MTQPIHSLHTHIQVAMSVYRYLREMANEADDDWQRELEKLYGNQAGDARYDERGIATSTLLALRDRKRQRDALLIQPRFEA